MTFTIIVIYITLGCLSIMVWYTTATYKQIFIAISIIIIIHRYRYVHFISWKSFGIYRKLAFTIIDIQTVLQLTDTTGLYIVAACSNEQIHVTIFVCIKKQCG